VCNKLGERRLLASGRSAAALHAGAKGSFTIRQNEHGDSFPPNLTRCGQLHAPTALSANHRRDDHWRWGRQGGRLLHGSWKKTSRSSSEDICNFLLRHRSGPSRTSIKIKIQNCGMIYRISLSKARTHSRLRMSWHIRPIRQTAVDN
jgi:hypothetical protein